MEGVKPEGRWYQNIVINGDEQPCKEPKRKNSKFWNEGKWDTFINPLLPHDCEERTFIEVGCDAGLFLKLAKDKGFKNVIGIEKSRHVCKIAQYYKESLGYNYKILNRGLNSDFNFSDLPLADVTLLSNMHYYVNISDFINYLDMLQYKTIYCLIISKNIQKDDLASGNLDDIRSYFKNWTEIDIIKDVPKDGDSCPRDIYSLLFKSKFIFRSPLCEIDKTYNRRNIGTSKFIFIR